MISLRAKIEAAAAVAILAGAGFGFTIWVQEHDDRIKAQAGVAAAQKAFDQLAADRREHQAADKARDDASAKQLEVMQAQAVKILTPAQIAAWIPKQIPGIPQPITITVPAPTPQNPQPDAAASIPLADLPVMRDTIEKCRESAVLLSTCQADLASRDAEMKLADKQIAQLKNERDDLQVELKGGTFWKRAKRAGHWLAIGGGSAIAALCASGHCKL